MMRQKIAGLLLASLLLAGMAMPLSASVGYPRGTASSVGPLSSHKIAVREATASNAETAAAAAVANAAAKGLSRAYVNFENISGSVSRSVVSAALNQASRGVSVGVRFRATVRNSNGKKSVVTQINLSAANLANLPANADFTVVERPSSIQSTAERNFQNSLKTVSAPYLGSEYTLCLKPGISYSSLAVYSYDPNTQTATRLDSSKYLVDRNGYVQIKGMGGAYILSDGALQER